MTELKLGLLPLYLQLYREVAPQYNEKVEAFADQIAAALCRPGVSVTTAPVSAVSEEISTSVKMLEQENVDAIVTLHLAYSPSLEAIDALTSTDLPLIMLDTTPDFEYPEDHSTLMGNHGIHGVQDLANLLRRRCRPYRLVVGHWVESKVLEETVNAARAAKCARAFRNSRVGRIGGDFKGMGDFVISPEAMEALGIEVIRFDAAKHVCPLEEKEIADVIKEYQAYPVVDKGDVSANLSSTAVASLLTRRFIETEKLSAFTCSFLDAHQVGVPSPPFAEACFAMSRGIGYAGEGDALDAAWLGALLKVFPAVTFTEMFTPDWKNNLVYLSHMGEVNVALLEAPSLRLQGGSYLPDPKPLSFVGSLKKGHATIANLTPGPGDTMQITTASGELIPYPEIGCKRISAYFKPYMSLKEFLRRFSQEGGTHHSALCYDVPEAFWDDLAGFLGIEHHHIG